MLGHTGRKRCQGGCKEEAGQKPEMQESRQGVFLWASRAGGMVKAALNVQR